MKKYKPLLVLLQLLLLCRPAMTQSPLGLVPASLPTLSWLDCVVYSAQPDPIPSTGVSISYEFVDAVLGVTVTHSWLTFDSAASEIVFTASQAGTAQDYDFQLKGSLLDAAGVVIS